MKAYKSFIHFWPFYIGCVALASFITCEGISIKCKPTDKERVMVFAASGTINISSVVKDGMKVVDSYIREMEVRSGYASYDDTSRLFGMVYNICDFYVFPESWVKRISPIAAKFSKSTINTLIPNSTDLNLLESEGTYIGIQIYNKDTKEGVMKSYITYDKEKNEENYYILFRQDSLHVGSLASQNSSNALKIVDTLLTK